MAHVGTFVIVRNNQASVIADRWAGAFATAWFARGPTNAETMATDFDEVAKLESGEAGFLLDFDRKTALVYDTAVRWDGSGTAVRLPQLRELDLTEEEAPLLEGALEAGRTSAAAFFAALADTYAGWALRWVDSTDAFRAYLDEHGIGGAKQVESRSDAAEANRAALSFLAALQRMGPEGAAQFYRTNAERKAQGLPELPADEWLEGRRE